MGYSTFHTKLQNKCIRSLAVFAQVESYIHNKFEAVICSK